jgi:hypothetical protein
MTTPYIDKTGALVVPNFADPKYQYWDESNPDRMTVAAILDEIGASDEVKAAYAQASPDADAEPAAVAVPDDETKRKGSG